MTAQDAARMQGVDAAAHCAVDVAPAARAGAGGSWDFFTNFGSYMPRTHCLRTAEGAVDWPWVIALIVLTAGVIAAYLKIYVFWRRSHLAEEARDRVTKLMHLANVFLWCAICGYVMSIVMFFWPAYRLLAGLLVVLNVFSWRFAANLGEFRVSFSAKRFRRQLDETLRARNAELERLVTERTAEAEQARAMADEANHSKSSFLANMSHEIRTPLTAIMGFLDVAIESEVPERERRESLRTVRRNCDHLLHVINDILDLSRIEAGRMTTERIECSAWEIAAGVVSLLRPRAIEKGLLLSVDRQGPIPAMALTDPTRLRQILTNLVGNAVKFTDNGGVRVTVSMAPGGADGERLLRFEVRDTGIGLTAEQASRLFRPFTQADLSTTRQFGGAGLGLSISRSLAQMLGGEIELESTPGEGSVFRLTIHPGSLAGVRMIESDEGLSGERRAEAEDGAKPLEGRILLVEDGPDNQRLIAHVLRRAGATVEFAENGRIAIEKLDLAASRGMGFDLVLLDMQMPEMDGYTAAGIMRRRSPCPPIVALTANAMSGDRDKCLAAGCDDFASKPIDRAALVEICAEWIGLRRADPESFRDLGRAA